MFCTGKNWNINVNLESNQAPFWITIRNCAMPYQTPFFNNVQPKYHAPLKRGSESVQYIQVLFISFQNDLLTYIELALLRLKKVFLK